MRGRSSAGCANSAISPSSRAELLFTPAITLNQETRFPSYPSVRTESSSDEVSVCMSNMLTLTMIELHVADCPYLQRPRTATCSKDVAYDEM